MRTFVVCLGFNTSEIIRGAFNNYVNTVTPEEDIVKWFFDPGYPGNDPESLKNLCSSFGWTYTKIDNEGVLANWNKVIHEHLNMVKGEFLVTFDPDVRMDEIGWLPAMRDILSSDDRLHFCSSSRDFHSHDWMQVPPYSRKLNRTAGGINYSTWDCLISWASGMWKSDLLITRPRNFGCAGKYYGWNEHADYDRLLAHGKTWCSATDFIDWHSPETPQDATYIEWKVKSAHKQTELKYEEWLNGNSSK